MRAMSFCVTASILAASALLTAPAQAVTQIANGTVSIAALFTPTVKLTSAVKTFKATNGATYEVLGTGGFSAVSNKAGKFNGTLKFSSVVGTVTDQILANFFTFNDGLGGTGTYNFSVESVQTLTYAVTTGVSSSISLYLLGTTTHAGFAPTATSLTLSFNSTGKSAYSTSATLAVPPEGAVPEPATWAMGVIGFGMMGAAMRRRARTAVTFG